MKSPPLDTSDFHFNKLISSPTVDALTPNVDPVSAATSSPKSIVPILLVTALAFLALLVKIMIALNTLGTNDVVLFYEFGRILTQHGLEWTYRHSIYFNHPPLTAYFLQAIYYLDHQVWFQDHGFLFPFLLRLPGIIADFISVLLVMRISKSPGVHIPTWAMALFAISPISLMVAGFHGNTDPIMVVFILAAALMCLKERPVLCGLFFALSCQVKVAPVLFFPIFLCFWFAHRKTFPFLISSGLFSMILWAEPLTRFPGLFVKSVFSYGSYWGIWGITYWLRLTGLPEFSRVSFYDLSLPQNLVVGALKLIIIAAVILIAWRRRNLDGAGPIGSIAYAWMIFFVFSPGISAQYMVWLAPFVLILAPTVYGWLTIASSAFLFFFYNVTAHGLPWYSAVSTNNLNLLWTPWSLWPWAVLIVVLFYFWKIAVAADPSLRLFSFQTLRAKARG
jgi:hypothetical protein